MPAKHAKGREMEVKSTELVKMIFSQFSCINNK